MKTITRRPSSMACGTCAGALDFYAREGGLLPAVALYVHSDTGRFRCDGRRGRRDPNTHTAPLRLKGVR